MSLVPSIWAKYPLGHEHLTDNKMEAPVSARVPPLNTEFYAFQKISASKLCQQRDKNASFEIPLILLKVTTELLKQIFNRDLL